jgi:hypothetical protein
MERLSGGVHQVILDGGSAAMLKALADAWNQRKIVSFSRQIAIEQDCPEVRLMIERDLTLSMQERLARDQLTALWVHGPTWDLWDRMSAPSDRLTITYQTLTTALPPSIPAWQCEVRALVVPMAAWDGVTWGPE